MTATNWCTLLTLQLAETSRAPCHPNMSNINMLLCKPIGIFHRRHFGLSWYGLLWLRCNSNSFTAFLMGFFSFCIFPCYWIAWSEWRKWHSEYSPGRTLQYLAHLLWQVSCRGAHLMYCFKPVLYYCDKWKYETYRWNYTSVFYIQSCALCCAYIEPQRADDVSLRKYTERDYSARADPSQ